ncbi:MAG: bifunctional 5,10-methylenetetrahydrofolate dehydrogenase/5,10-methenyltetrahydrofolate cyclohydrolase [Clostridium sp.]
MMKVLKGKPVADAIKDNLIKDIEKLKERGMIPTLAVVRVGNRTDDVSYENSILKRCSTMGIETKLYILDFDIAMEEFTDILDDINKDKNIHGILTFRPLPKHLDAEFINGFINKDKDSDCMNPVNLEKIFEGKMDGVMPCTPEAVMEILKFYGYNLQGKNVAVINRSMVVGKPLSMMLLAEDATVTICHSRSKNLSEITSKADIVITAVGRANMLDSSYFNKESVVIDVSINDAGEGKICGDVNFESVRENVSAITPVPGGVGSVTTNLLLKHVVQACKNNVV